MRTLFDASGALCRIMAALSKVLIGILILLVVSDVALRNLGLRPLAWAVTLSEYSLLYITFLAMPLLVRNKGHVFVEFLRAVLPPPAQLLLERLVYLACLCLCLYLFWYAASSLIVSIQRGTFEMRTFDMPKWAIFAPITLGFGLSAVEWLRFLLGQDTMYDRDLLETGGH